jgi:hypothetical protein
MTPGAEAADLQPADVARLANQLAEELQVALRAIETQERHHASGLRVTSVVVRVGQDARPGDGLQEVGWQVEMRVEPGAVGEGWRVEPLAPPSRLGALEVARIDGVDRAWEERLRGADIRTVAQLAAADPMALAAQLGRRALELHAKARLAVADLPPVAVPDRDASLHAAAMEPDGQLAERWPQGIDVTALRAFLLRLEVALDEPALRRLRLSDLAAASPA